MSTRSYKCGHCGGRHQDLEQVKACSQVSNDKVSHNADRIVTATCVRWVTQEDEPSIREVHNYTALLSQVAGQKCCPDHR